MQPRELTPGVPLTGGALADFMPQFAAAINKAEPLNIPSIFEAAQNGAVNRAVSAFSVALTTSLDARLAEPPRATVMLGSLIETDIMLLLAQLSSTISYMPQATVQQAQDQAREQSATPKASALTVNLTRLKGVMATNLNNAISAILSDSETLFQGLDGQVSEAEAQAHLNSLASFRVSSFQRTGDNYDSRSFPDGWQQAFTDAVDTLKPSLWTKITTAWAQWASKLKTGKMEGLTTRLVLLGESKHAGEGNAYASESLTRTQTAKDEFNGLIDGNYRWHDKADQKAEFATMFDNAAHTRRALWDQNDAAIRTQLASLSQRLQLQYDIKLQSSQVPQVEPPTYFMVTDDSQLQVGRIPVCH